MIKSGMVILSLLVILAIGNVSVAKNVNNPSPAKKPVQVQPEKPSPISTEYSELNIAINHMEKSTFAEFKRDTATAFDEISELIPRILPSGKKLSAMAKKDVTTIEKVMKKIESDKTPDQVISNEKTGINAAVSALKNINNDSASKFPDLENKLISIQDLTKKIDAKNYQRQSVLAFKELSSTMQAMSNHHLKAKQPKK